jgi:hypothetical protein
LEFTNSYSNEKGNTMGNHLGGILIGMVMIVGGLSGKLVLIGTHSGGALAILGGVLIAVDLVKIVKAKANRQDTPQDSAPS